MDNCGICGIDKDLVKHHTDYEKNIVIKVCRKCHILIHRTDKFPQLVPQGHRYIKQNKKLTSISIEDTTLEKLKAVKLTKRESYDEIINRLLKND